MTAYAIKVTERAQQDLMVLHPQVQDILHTVIETELRPWPRPDDPDEGSIPDHLPLYTAVAPDQGLRWRRGTTRRIRHLLDAGLSLNAAIEEACDHLIIYLVDPVPPRSETAPRHPCRLKAIRVLPIDVVARAFQNCLENPPGRSGTRGLRRSE